MFCCTDIFSLKEHASPDASLQFYLGKCIGKGVIDGLFCLLCLFSQISVDILFAGAFSFFFLPLLESGEFFFITAGADKSLSIAFPHQLQFFVAHRAAGVSQAGEGFTVSAFSVLADEHTPVLSVYLQHKFAALRAFGARDIVVPEGSGGGFDFLYEGFGVPLNLTHEMTVCLFSFGDCLQAHLPLRGQLRALQILGHEGEELASLGSDMQFFAFLLHEKASQQFIDNVGAGGDSPQSSCLA